MTLKDHQLEKLTQLPRGPLTSRLPGLCSRKNAALIAAVKAKETTEATLKSVRG